MYNLRLMWCRKAYHILLTRILFSDPLSYNHLKVWPKNTLHLFGLYASTCEDKVRLFYAIKCNKFYRNFTFLKLNTYLILTWMSPPTSPLNIFFWGPKIQRKVLNNCLSTLLRQRGHPQTRGHLLTRTFF